MVCNEVNKKEEPCSESLLPQNEELKAVVVA